MTSGAEGTQNGCAAQETVRASSAGAGRTLPHGEEARIGATGADFQFDAARAARAMPQIGRPCSVDVDPRVDVAAGELNADEASAAAKTASGRDVGLTARIARQIEILANHWGEVRGQKLGGSGFSVARGVQSAKTDARAQPPVDDSCRLMQPLHPVCLSEETEQG